MLFGGVLPAGEQLLVAPHRPALDGVAEERRPGRAAEAELVDDVRPRVARPVDVELVLRGRRERVVVRAGRRILTRDPVGDDRDRVRLVRAPERVQVGVVGARILRDQRRLAVTGGGAGARAGADDRSAERCDRDCSESGGRQGCLLHGSHTPASGLLDSPRSAECGDRFDRDFGANRNRPAVELEV